MAKDCKHKPFDRHRLSSAEDGVKGVSVGPPIGRAPRKNLWPVLLWLTLLFVGGGVAFLWPVFEAVGTGVAVGMIPAVLVLSLTPLLLLRTILKRETNEGPARRAREQRRP